MKENTYVNRSGVDSANSAKGEDAPKAKVASMMEKRGYGGGGDAVVVVHKIYVRKKERERERESVCMCVSTLCGRKTESKAEEDVEEQRGR